MVVQTIYLSRHGFRLSWETNMWNAPTGTPRDPPLSAHGVDQAVELAHWFAVQPDKPQVIYSSPLYRCLQTAAPISESLSLPIYVEHGLAEWYLPVRRGLHPRSLPASELKEWFPTIDATAHESLLYPSQKGESVIEVHERAEEVLRRLIQNVDKMPGVQHIVLLTHAATNIALARALVGDRDLNVRSATCSVGKYQRVEGSEGQRRGLGTWELLLNGDTSFLTGGEERHWDFSYVEEYEEDGVLEDGSESAPLASDKYATVESAPSNTRSPGKL